MSHFNSSQPVNSRYVVTGSIFVFIAAFGFSAKAILIKLVYVSSEVDPITLMGLRMAMSLPFFLLSVIWFHRDADSVPLNRRDWLVLIVLGTIGYYLASLLDFTGLVYISAGLERLILFLYPTMVVLFSAVLYRRAVELREIAALTLSYTGIVLVFIGNSNVQSNQLWLGTGLVFGSAVVFALYMMGSGIMIRRIGSARFTAYSMTVACVVTTAHFGIHQGIRQLILPPDVYGFAFLMAILSTVVPAFFMNAGIRRLGSGHASIISSAGPVATLILAYLLLDEALTVWQIIGTVLVLTGVITTSLYFPPGLRRR